MTTHTYIHIYLLHVSVQTSAVHENDVCHHTKMSINLQSSKAINHRLY